MVKTIEGARFPVPLLYVSALLLENYPIQVLIGSLKK